MAGHQLIDAHVATLARRLPAGPVDELADGLTETWHRHLDAGLPPTAAAHAAIAEFGSPDQITDAFVAESPGRRTARMLLATGPLVGACWGAALLTSDARSWPVPTPAAALFAATLLAVVATLTAAATSRHNYRRTRLGAAGGCALIALDTTMLLTALLLAPTAAGVLLAAAPASLARIALTARALPAALTR